MTDLDAFEARYRGLAVVTCEWRAFQVADPEVLADRVFARLRSDRRTPDLKVFYRAVERVVADAYRNFASGRTLAQGWPILQRSPRDTDQRRKALTALPASQVETLRQAFWDELTPAEMAEVTGRDAATQQAKLTQALHAFAAKLRDDDAAQAMRDLHPGTHRRSGNCTAG